MSNFMDIAFQEAENAAKRGEVPVGAVLVSSSSQILARSGNLTETNCDPTGHAEIIVLRTAARSQVSPRLSECDLYVTLEPCAMCAAAVSFARIRRLIFAAYDPKGGGVEHGAKFFGQSTCHHIPEIIGGIDEHRSAQMLKDFFQIRR